MIGEHEQFDEEPMIFVGGEHLDGSARFAVPTAKVAADVVDDEVVIVNLETGSYFTTEGAGCETWRLLEAGLTIDEVIAVLRDRYDDDRDLVGSYVRAIVAVALDQGLLVDTETGGAAGALDLGPPPDRAGILAPVTERVPFTAPDFVNFDDMKGLLLLDPVHEVDDRGWPHAAPGV